MSCSTRATSARTSSSAIGLGSAEPLPPPDAIKQRFFAEHERAYGFYNPADPIEIVNFRLIAVGKLRQPGARPGEARKTGTASASLAPAGSGSPPTPRRTRRSTIARR